MTEDKKLKQNPIGQIRYYWNLATFARHFEVEVDAPPDKVAWRLIGIEKRGYRTRRIVEIVTIKERESYTFDLHVKRADRGVLYTTVKATGKVVYSQGYDKTIVRGDIRIGWIHIGLSTIPLCCYALFSLAIGIQTELIGFLILAFALLFVVVGYSWSIQYDYKELTHQIQETLKKAQDTYSQHVITDPIELHLK